MEHCDEGARLLLQVFAPMAKGPATDRVSLLSVRAPLPVLPSVTVMALPVLMIVLGNVNDVDERDSPGETAGAAELQPLIATSASASEGTAVIFKKGAGIKCFMAAHRNGIAPTRGRGG